MEFRKLFAVVINKFPPSVPLILGLDYFPTQNKHGQQSTLFCFANFWFDWSGLPRHFLLKLRDSDDLIIIQLPYNLAVGLESFPFMNSSQGFLLLDLSSHRIIFSTEFTSGQGLLLSATKDLFYNQVSFEVHFLKAYS